jgi:tetratricopeptide (TPR) repeat protein
LIEQGRFAEALEEADAALQQDPDFLLALGNRAWALEGLGRLEEAAAGYERVLAKNPDFTDLRAKLAGLRSRMRTESTTAACPPGIVRC